MNKPLMYVLGALLVSAIALGSFAGGFIAGHLLPLGGLTADDPLSVAAPTISPDQLTATPTELQTLFAPFWEAWTLVHENYVDQPVDDVALLRGAIRGMMEALGDEHSSYMDPQAYEQANAGLEGEYEGIGAYVDTTTEYLTITSPMPGSPAERAGLKPGDQVMAIDGEDMSGIPGEAVRLKIVGPAGTTVHLTILREGEQDLLEFDVVREKITMASASGEMLEGGIAYIQVTTFGAKTNPELLAALTDLMEQKPRGLILDLRNNGGGYLQTAVEVTSQFVDDGVVLYEQYGNGSRTTYDVIPGGLAADPDLPMVVLINEGSASASEIVAGALQDLGRAELVGVTSYGKGSVQNWIPLSGENGAVRVTIAKWLTPNERAIHQAGLTPDHVVEMTAEDYEADRDPQLDAAVQFLLHTLAGTAYVYEAPPTPTPSEPAPAEPAPTESASPVVDCPLAVPARLNAGQPATVIHYLYLRSSPGIGNNRLQTLRPNTKVDVVGNPTCIPYGDGAYIWWLVKLPDGATGWLAEGSSTRKLYFVEPER